MFPEKLLRRAGAVSVLSAILSFSGGCAASMERQAAPPVPMAERPYKKCIAAPFVSGQVTVDGVPGESVWQKATLFCDFQDPATGSPAASRTEARIFHDENYLYLGLKCFDRRGELTVADGHGNSLWGADHVELFIGSPDPEPNVLQFVWGPGRAVYGAGPHWETKSRIFDDHWSSETRIRLSALAPVNSVTGIHLVREVKKSRARCYWSYVGRDFFSIQNYAELILGSYAQAARVKFHRDHPGDLSREAYEKINARLTPPRHRIVRGPWLFTTACDKMSIGWCTAGRTGSLLEYRRRGEGEFRPVCSGYDDHRWDKDRRLHKVHLTGLAPGTVYEYRIKNMDRNEKDLVQYPRDGSCYTFSTHGKKDLTFAVFTDVHGDGGLWKELIDTRLLRECDLIVNLGDMVSNGAGVRSIFHGYLDSQLAFAARKPLLNFRGNHEYVGTSPGSFDEIFGSPGWKGYALCRFGDVCLIGLDVWNGTQREWLKKAVGTREFRTAKHRIVLAHYPAVGTMSAKEKIFCRDLDGIFTGKDPSSRIDLYLCGHQHRGAFVAKNTDSYVWMDNGKSRKVDRIPFDMIVNEGPRILHDNTVMLVEAKGDSLSVKLLNRDGSLYRAFKIK